MAPQGTSLSKGGVAPSWAHVAPAEKIAKLIPIHAHEKLVCERSLPPEVILVAHLFLHGPKAASGEPQQRRQSEPYLAGDARCASRREGSLTTPRDYPAAEEGIFLRSEPQLAHPSSAIVERGA